MNQDVIAVSKSEKSKLKPASAASYLTSVVGCISIKRKKYNHTFAKSENYTAICQRKGKKTYTNSGVMETNCNNINSLNYTK